MSENEDQNKGGRQDAAVATATCLWLDAIADRFDAAWQSAMRGAPRPKIEDFLSDTDEHRRPELLRELILLDVELRRGHGEAPKSEDYADHFPDQRAWLTDLLLPVTEVPSPPTINKRFHPKPGEPLGDYELLEEIGHGGMGRVFKARHTKLKRVVALKMILAGQLATDELVQRFRNEAQAAAKLDHSGIVPVFEVGEQGGLHFYAMGFVEGESLAARVASGPLPPRDAAEIVRQVAEAVHYAHEQGIIHRDLKPANILLVRLPENARSTGSSGSPQFDSDSPPGSSRRFAEQSTLPDHAGITRNLEAKVTDFGLAKLLDSDSGLSLTGLVLGTPSYMPPEQARGQHRDVGRAADVYSLGAVLYCLMTGRPPFQAASHSATLDQVLHQLPVPPRQLNPSLPRDLETICLKCLDKDPSRRFSRAIDLAQELRRFLNREPIHSRPTGRGEKLWRWCQRNPVVAGLTAGVAAALLLGTIVSSYFAIQALTEAKRANDKADEAVSNLYAANINQAQYSWESARVATTLELLDRWIPKPGEMDRRGWEWYYLKRLCDSNSRTLKGHVGWVRSVTFSPDGRNLASGSADHTIKLWDVVARNELRTLQGHTDQVWTITFSPDSQQLASASWDGTVKLWDVATGQVSRTLKGHSGHAQGVSFSPDGGQLATAGGEDNSLKLWSVATGQELQTFKGHTSGIMGVTFSPDGNRLVSAGYDGTVRLWDAKTGQQLRSIAGHRDRVWTATFSPNGKQLASASSDHSVKLWDAETGEEIRTLKGHTAQVWCVKFSPDGKSLASASWDQTVKLWEVLTGKDLGTLRGHTDLVLSVAFSPDGKRLASGSHDQTVKLWDALPGRSQEVIGDDGLKVFKRHTGQVFSVAFAPKEHLFASASGDETVRVWDLDKGHVLRILKGHRGEVISVAFSPDGQRLASAGADQTVKLWDKTTGKELRTLSGHRGRIWCVAFSPDGEVLASASSDQTVKVWDTVTGKERYSLQGHTDLVWSVAFSPDGQRIASASEDQTIKLWQSGTAQELHTLKGHSDRVWCVTFSPDGQYLASSGTDRTVRLWNPVNGHALHVLKGHSLLVRQVAFSPDSQRLVSASEDQTVMLWDPKTGHELLTLKGHGGPIFGVTFSPDGRLIASSDHDGSVKIADAGTAPPMRLRLSNHSSR